MPCLNESVQEEQPDRHFRERNIDAAKRRHQPREQHRDEVGGINPANTIPRVGADFDRLRTVAQRFQCQAEPADDEKQADAGGAECKGGRNIRPSAPEQLDGRQRAFRESRRSADMEHENPKRGQPAQHIDLGQTPC